jgi:deoxyxylulose-5-phosphate synthase
MTHRAINVSKELRNVGIVDMFMLNPFNEKLLFETLKEYEFILTLEEGFVDKGGVGALVADVFRKNELDIKIKSMGFADEYVFDLGDRNHLHEISGLSEKGIIDNIKRYC